jgi:hypothetical protein
MRMAVDLMREGVYPDVTDVVLGHVIAGGWKGEYASAREVADGIGQVQERYLHSNSRLVGNTKGELEE